MYLPTRFSKDFTTLRVSFSQVFLMAAILINVAVAVAIPGPITSLLSTVFYIILVFRLFQKLPIAFLLFSPITFLHFSVLISLNAIEAGALMKEMGRIGFPSAASAIYVVVAGVFLKAASTVYAATEKNSRASAIRLDAERYQFLTQWAAMLLGCLAIVFLVLKGLISGFPVLDHIDRFEYRRVSGDKITLYFLNLKLVLSSFIGLSAACCSSSFNKLRHHVVFIGYIGVCFLFGDKFFNIISACLYYLAVQLVYRPEVIKEVAGRFFVSALLVIMLATAMTVYIYSGNGTLSAETTMKLLFDRFAEQGQLWFVAANNAPEFFKFETQSVIENFNSIFYIPAQDYVFDHHLGAFHFIFKYAPFKMLFSFIGNQGFVAPIMSFEAYGLELFGFVGMFFMVAITGMILGLTARAIMNAIYSGNPFNILLPTYFLVQVYYMIVSGNISTLVGLGAFKAYTALFVFQVLISAWIKNTQPVVSRKATPSRADVLV